MHFLRSLVVCLIRTVEVVVALGIVAGGLVMWRLYADPVEIKEFLPTLERYILPRDSGLTLQADSVMLGAEFNADGLIHLNVRDMQVLQADGKVALRLPTVKMSYGLGHLLTLDYMPNNMKIERAFLRLLLDKGGQIRLYGDSQDMEHHEPDVRGVMLGEQGPLTIRKIIRHLMSFDTLSLENARVLIDNREKKQRFSLRQVNIAMERQAGFNHAIKMSALLKLKQELTNITAEAQFNRISRQIGFDVDFDRLNLQRVAQMIPVLKGARLTVSGHLTGIFDFKPTCTDLLSCLKQAAFQFKTVQGGTLNLPDPLTNLYHIDSAVINGAVSESLAQIKIAKSTIRLKNGPTATLQVDVSGIGDLLSGADLKTVKTVLRSDISALPITDVPSVWPVKTGPDAHAWVKKNLTAGTVPRASFTLYFDGDELTDLYGEMPVQNVQVHYLDDMTPVDDFSGLVRLYPDKVLITGQTGKLRGLSLTQADIALTDLQQEIAQADITLNVSGPVRDAMTLIAEKPLEFPQMFGINPNATDGQARVKTHLAFPLIDDLKQDQVQVQVEADITDGIFPTPLPDEMLKHGNLGLSVTNKQLLLKGTGRIGDLPLTLKWTEDFTAHKATDVQSVYDVRVKAPMAALHRLWADVPRYATGKMAVRGKITTLVNGQMQADVQADLAGAELNLVPLSVHKSVGVPMTISADARWQDRMGTIDFKVQGMADSAQKQPIRVSGKVQTGHELRVSLEQVIAPQTDFSGTLVWQENHNLGVKLQGKSWNLSALAPADTVSQPTTSEQERTEAETPEDSPVVIPANITLDIALDTFIFKPDLPLTHVRITGDKQDYVWQNMAVSATGKQPFTMTYTPKTRKLTAKSADVGDLLQRLGITDKIIGGTLNATAKQQTRGGFSGTVKVRDFSLKDPGFLIQSLTVLGLVDAIRGEDLRFDRAELPFEWQPNPIAVVIEEGYMSGTSLGLTFNGRVSPVMVQLRGSVIPAYAINSLPGRIPFVGRLFKDGTGGGLIGVNYEVKGAPWKPVIDFNPFSSVAPGILRRLFN